MAVNLIDVRGTDDMHGLGEDVREYAMELADYFATQAASLKERIIAQYAREGLTHRGLSGSDAAIEVTHHLVTVADHMLWAAQAMGAAVQGFDRHVVEPIMAARAANDTGADALLI